MILPPLCLTLSLSPPSLHPTISLHLHPLPPIPPTACNLHARVSIQLPDTLFLDPDELTDKFVGSAISNYSSSSTSGDRARIDIERPASYPSLNGDLEYTILDLVVKPPTPMQKKFEEGKISLGDEGIIVQIPLHARYLYPNKHGEEIITFPDSIQSEIRGEWICESESSSSSPPPTLNPQPIQITLPTGKHSHQPFIELITPIIIWLGWFWLVYKIFRWKNRINNSIDLESKKDN